MTTHVLIATCLFGIAAAGLTAQEPQATARYRDYALGASLASVVATSGDRDALPRTLHERPERLQTLEWRARYSGPEDAMADPVRDMRFYFVGDELYRIDIHYDRGRTLGLTSADLVEAIDLLYEDTQPVRASRATVARDFAGDMTVVRQWGLPSASLTLLGRLDAPEYMLVLLSTPLAARATAAAREAERLDLLEAPQRALDARRQDVRDTAAAQQRARARNKPAFRP